VPREDGISEGGLLGADEARQIIRAGISPKAANEGAASFAAASDPLRLRLLSFLAAAQRPACVSDLAAMAGVSLSSASHHLRKAKAAGLVESRRSDKRALYSLTKKGRRLVELARRETVN